MENDSFLSKFDELLHQKRFFELRDEVAKRVDETSLEMLFYQGAIANKFNRMQESIALLQNYLNNSNPTGERLRNCYELLGDNYAKSYQYKLAGEKYAWLVENCAEDYAGEKRQHLEYLNNIWNAASDVPPQTISFTGDTQVQAIRLESDHLETPVTINNEQVSFVFDTGANISAVISSTARKLGLEIIDRDISVGTSTDIRVDAKLAVASTFKFGNVECSNVIFLVLKDEDLYLKKRKYQLNGIIGYPVMQACRQISISANGKISIPAEITEQRPAEQNLCFDDMMPLINFVYKALPMTFLFDTGARKSQFWSKFFKSQEAEILKNAKLQTIDFGGVGGRRNIKAYIWDKLPVNFMGKTIFFEEAQIFLEPLNELSRNFFGNIGQDFMKQFEKMTIDFDLPGITFE